MVGEDTLNLLLCHEYESSFNDDDETLFKRSDEAQGGEFQCTSTTTIGEGDEDYVAELVRKENLRFGDEPIKTTSSFDRLIAINWILTTRTRFGFQHQTAYIAISYFDLFLKKRFIGLQRDETWAMRLLSVACLSLAAKIEERNVPGLSQYPQDQDFLFKPDVILKTELMILSTLDWKLNLITPFHYLNYFISKTKTPQQQQQSQDLVLLRSSESLLVLIKEMSFTDYRQFAVAAATTLLASSSSVIRLTREEMSERFSSISWWTSSDNENVFLCYQRMLEIEDKKLTMTPPETAVSEDVKTPPGAASGSGGAKRRLSFDDDQISPSKKMRRL